MRLQCFFVCYRQFQKKVSQNCSDWEDNLKEYKTSVNQLQKKIAEDPLYRINQLILFQSTKLFCLLFNQIVRFFYQQYLRKESIDILYFLPGECHQGKVTYLRLPLWFCVANCTFYPIRIQNSLIRNICGRDPLMRYLSREGDMWDIIFGLVGLGVSHIQYSQKNPSIIKSPKSFFVFNLARYLWKKGIFLA